MPIKCRPVSEANVVRPSDNTAHYTLEQLSLHNARACNMQPVLSKLAPGVPEDQNS